MIEFLVLLLSTDWFLPHWTEIGIELPERKKRCIQQGCRSIIDQMTSIDSDVFVRSLNEHLRQDAESKFLALLVRCDTEPEMSAAHLEWAKLSHRELTAAVLCALLNRDVPSADGSGTVPQLEFPIRTEVVKTWEGYALDASVFREVCLSSETAWDLRTRKLLVSPKTLVNQLWRVLLDQRLRAFWAELGQRLTSEQIQGLVSWYRTMIKTSSRQDGTIDVPPYMIS